MKILAAVVVLAAGASTGQCTPAPQKECGVELRGLEVHHGRVTDTLTVWCSKRPQEHLFQYWLDYKGPSDEFTRLSLRVPSVYDIPSVEGYTRTVSADCVKGWYQTHYVATGVSSAGIAFDFESTGWRKFFDVEDCAA